MVEALLVAIFTHSHHLQNELLQIPEPILPNSTFNFVQGRKISYVLDEVFESDKLVEIEVVGVLLNVLEELRAGEEVAHLGSEE